MLTRTQKEQQVADMKAKFERATSVIVADYRGLSVPAVNELRSKLRAEEDEYEYRVTKNSILRRAAEGLAIEALAPQFEGPTAVALAYGDPVRLAKILVDYAKENEVFELKAGLVDGQAVELAELQTLATLPSLDELRGQLVGLVMAPASKLARLLMAPPGQLARVVEARRAALEESGDAG